MTSKQENTMIRGMINYTKKWWLLGCHRRAERFFSTNGSNDGGRVLLSPDLFIDGNGVEHKGLKHKYNSFVRFRLSHLIFWKKEYSEEQLKMKRHEYYELYNICAGEKYITAEKVEKVNDVSYPTVSNPKAYNIGGFPIGYFQGLFKTYNKFWFAIGALIIAIIGSSLFIGDDKPTINVYPPNIDMPEIKPEFRPVINVYPNVQQR